MKEKQSETLGKHKRTFLTVSLTIGGGLLFWLFFWLPAKPDDRLVSFANSVIPDLIATVIVALIVTVTWEQLTKIQKQNEKAELLKDINDALYGFWSNEILPDNSKFIRKLLIGVNNISKGLVMDKATTVFEKASWYIADCKEIRVIGTINPHQSNDKAFESDGAFKCVKATEKRIQEANTEANTIVYRRITALNLENIFRAHLQRCFEEKTENSNLQLIFLEDFTPAYSYLIIDNKFLMVSLTYDKTIEQKICLYTETNKYFLIDEFIRHFDELWTNETSQRKNAIITNKEDFDIIHAIQSQAEKKFKILKERINQFPPKSTLFQKQALKDLALFSEHFKYEEETIVRHSTANENLIQIFINYLGFLEKGDSYRTITFCSFWSNLFAKNGLLEQFVNANSTALHNGVELERLLVIDESLLSTDKLSKNGNLRINNYIKILRLIIGKNVRLMEKYPAYKFRLLFTNKHNEWQHDLYNFALITSNQTNETIIFKPIREGKKITSTLITKDKDTLVGDEEKYLELTGMWETQKPTAEHIAFIKSLKYKKEIISRLVKDLL